MQNRRQSKYHFLPVIVLGCGIIFLLAMLLTTNPGVFYSGDAGLKFLMVKQRAGGGSAVFLQLDNVSWVKDLWLQGYYPFKEPFVYNLPGKKVVAFPPAFQWLTAFLYNGFGFRALYLIPSVSLLTLWLSFYFLLRRLKIEPLVISAGLVLIVFCAPLSIYGAIYWEHTLATALIYAAVVFMLTNSLSARAALVFGVITGTACWFRPEMLLLCLLFMAALRLGAEKDKRKTNKLFVIGTSIPLVAFFVFNLDVYGNILGAHSYQLATTHNLTSFFKEKFTILIHLNGRLAVYFPFILVFYLFAISAVFKKITMPVSEMQLTVTIILFLAIVPFALPNAGGKQWGPRYLLAVIPMLVTLLCFWAKQFEILRARKALWLSLSIIALYSISLNSYRAFYDLKNDYSYRVKPGLDYLTKAHSDIVVVQNQFIAQEYATLFDSKKIFLAETQSGFNSLTTLLRARGLHKIIYISHDKEFERERLNLLTNKSDLKQLGDYYFAEYEIGK